MYYLITLFVGVITGAVCMCLILMDWHKKSLERDSAAQLQAQRAAQAMETVQLREAELSLLNEETTQKHQEMSRQLAELQRRTISYKELKDENAILKRDLQNIDVNLHKLELDGELRGGEQRKLDERTNQLAKRYLSETVKAVVASIGPSNFSVCKTRLLDVISKCREIGFEIRSEEEAKLLADLRIEFEKAVRAAFEREEQARIKAQIREEEKLKREIDRELRQLERERAAIQAALDQALAEARGEFTAEVQRLQAKLTEAEEKSKRAISLAQQTKAGHVYVISNIGTFGTDVFKIGMTRRLDPQERVGELGSASVPFPFDVHMMISCNNAPALENALHRALHKRRVNRANPRKEFFRANIEDIRKIVVAHHGEVQYSADAEALEYRQSIGMTEEDADFIESVYDAAEDDVEGA